MGDERIMKEMNPYIPYARQEITDRDISAVVEALHAPLITQGPRVEEFEEAVATMVGADYAVVFNSGTAALHAAYHAAGIGPERGILTTPITFAATSNAALYLRARVAFSDVDPRHALIDLDTLGDADGIGAVVPVHFAGSVPDMMGIHNRARSAGWSVIEDAAHALGSVYQDGEGKWYQVGACAHSDMCCFSFHAVKHITSGEGGAVTTNSREYADRLRRFRTHGITREQSELASCAGAWYYEQHDLGFNYRLCDILCALGMSQLTRLPQNLERRRALASMYDDMFSGNELIAPLSESPACRSARHLYIVRVPANMRSSVFDDLRTMNIGVNVHYLPVYAHPYYQSNGFSNLSRPNAERYYSEAITLPLYPALSEDDVLRVVRSIVSSVETHAAKP